MHHGHPSPINPLPGEEVTEMPKVKNTCAKKCTVEGGKRICPIMVPLYDSAGSCRPRTPDEFDSSSLFEKKSGKATITIGCPKGHWDAGARRCSVGTRALKMPIDS